MPGIKGTSDIYQAGIFLERNVTKNQITLMMLARPQTTSTPNREVSDAMTTPMIVTTRNVDIKPNSPIVHKIAITYFIQFKPARYKPIGTM